MSHDARAAGLQVTMDRLVAISNGIPSLHTTTGGLLWPSESLVRDCLDRAKARGADVKTIKTCETYFTRQLTKQGSSRFVASVLASWLNMSEAFQSGPVAELLLSEDPTFTADCSRRGRIVVLALPVAEYGAAGRGMTAIRGKLGYFGSDPAGERLPGGSWPFVTRR